MKAVRVSLLMIWLFSVSFIIFRPKNLPTKTYTVSLSYEQWAARARFVNDAKEIMRKSSYPGNIISQVSDSLEIIVKDINEQVGTQLLRESESKRIQDSIQNAKPKK